MPLGETSPRLFHRGRAVLRWAWGRRKRIALLALLTAFALLNAAAYLHARAMTHYTAGGTKTAGPQGVSPARKVRVLLTGVSLPRPTNYRTPAELQLPFEVCEFPAADGGRLEAWHVGRPHAKGLVLVFHGYAACKAMMLHQARAFYDMGYAVLLVDFRGSGGSSGSDTTLGVREAQDVATAVEYARSRWAARPLVLYGHSMGGAAVLGAVARHGVQPDALIAECTFDRLLNTVGNRFALMGLPAFPAANLLVFWGGWQCGFDGFRHNPAEYAAAVTCPTLLLHGDRDVTVTMEQARSVYEVLAGPQQFELFPGVGHELIVTARPERWKQAVGPFLERHARH